MKILWICDEWSIVNQPAETSILMLAASAQLGNQNWVTSPTSIFLDNSSLFCFAQPVEPVNARELKLCTGSYKVKISFFQKIFFRCNPPFDLRYIQVLQLIYTACKNEPGLYEVINDPAALLFYNSKILSQYLPKYQPESLISSDWHLILDTGLRLGRTVLKPLHDGGSGQIQLLNWDTVSGTRNYESVNAVSSGFRLPVLLQEYLDVRVYSEIRIWFVNGRFFAAAQKKICRDDFIFQIEKGDTLEKYIPDKEAEQLIAEVGSLLRRLHIRFCAVDIIKNKIIDFNIVGPGLIAELELMSGENYAYPLMRELLSDPDWSSVNFF